jgi:hypothetical protein
VCVLCEVGRRVLRQMRVLVRVWIVRESRRSDIGPRGADPQASEKDTICVPTQGDTRTAFRLAA